MPKGGARGYGFGQTVKEGKKGCTRCRRWLPVHAFKKHPSSTTGLDSWCYPCHRAHALAHYRDGGAGRALLRRMNDPAHFLVGSVSGAKEAARRRGLVFTLTLADVEALLSRQGRRCYYTGIPLTLTAGRGRVDTNLSYERLDTEKGYVAGNVVLC